MRIGNLEFRFAKYDQFWIDSEAQQYRLHVEGYSGTAGKLATRLELGKFASANSRAFQFATEQWREASTSP